MTVATFVRTAADLEALRRDVDAIMNRVRVDGDSVVIDSHLNGKKRPFRVYAKQRIARIFGKARRAEERRRTGAFITVVMPAHNEQRDIMPALESLVLQTRPADRIVVVVNGTTDKTAELAGLFAEEFPGMVEVVNNPTYVTRSGRTKEVRSKVAALNYAWHHYIANEPSRGTEEFVFGCDADVKLAPDAIEQLEKTLLDDMDDQKVGGVRAVYSFEVPEDADFRTRSLIEAQQLDFAATELKDQLRSGGRVTILGGQATLFRREALEKVSQLNKGNGPWVMDTLVEDAYLTRQLEQLGYVGVINSKAHSVVGAMTTSYALQAQRRKWQNGHLIDLAGDKRFALDRVRWSQQFALGWNWLLRAAFVTLLLTSMVAGVFEFNALWLIPLGLASLQNLLIASRMKDRNPGLMVRAATYLLPEVHIWRTLGVWVMSLRKGFLAFVNTGRVDQSDWVKQARAEASRKTGAWATWFAFGVSVLLPAIAMMAVGFALPSVAINTLWVGWQVVAGMSIVSSAFMVVKIMRIVKNYHRLSL